MIYRINAYWAYNTGNDTENVTQLDRDPGRRWAVNSRWRKCDFRSHIYWAW